MAITNMFPLPALGDIFVRKNLNSLEEESMILSVMYNPKAPALWQATMQTKNGIEFVTGDREHRNIHDWRPKGWIFDEVNNNWYSASDKAKLDAERAEAAAKEAAKEPEHKDDFVVADAAAIPNAFTKQKKSALPKVDLPTI
jgi:hypothetical protein